MFNSTGLTALQITVNVQNKLAAHRRALEDLADVYAWSSGVAASDLVAIGFSAADAQSLLNAIADAHGEYMIHTTGTDPRNPPAPYIYAASQNALLGPQ